MDLLSSHLSDIARDKATRILDLLCRQHKAMLKKIGKGAV